ncbi:MAG: hypothetical protein HZB51_23350 [Chloroflexi bacterium]|nr:hypothetical protein [Chloroflexota bacterium]
MIVMSTASTPHRLLLILIYCIYCLLATMYAVLVPPWEAPDEPAHYRYVSELASRWRPAVNSGIRQKASFAKDYDFISSNYEWTYPALGYVPAALAYATIHALAPQSLPTNIPPQNTRYSQDSKQLNLFLHPNNRVWDVWYGNEGLLAIRIFLALWGLGVLYATTRVGNLLDSSGLLAVVASGLVAFLPQFTFINASVRSDTITNVVAGFTLLLAVQLQFRPNQINRSALVLGILIGAGTLCKYTFLFILPIAIIAIPLSQPRFPTSWTKPLFCMLIPFAILIGAYYLSFEEARIALAYTLNNSLTPKSAAFFWEHLGLALELFFITLFYAGFGWANVIPPAAWARLALGAWLIGTIITLVQAFKWIKIQNSPAALRAIVLLTLSLLFAITGVFGLNLSQFQPQGRFLFPTLVAWAIVCLWGAWQILSLRGKIILGISSVGFMLAFNLYAIFFTLIPAYYHGIP